MRARSCFCASLPVFIFQDLHWYFENRLLDECQTVADQFIQLIMGTETKKTPKPGHILFNIYQSLQA